MTDSCPNSPTAEAAGGGGADPAVVSSLSAPASSEVSSLPNFSLVRPKNRKGEKKEKKKKKRAKRRSKSSSSSGSPSDSDRGRGDSRNCRRVSKRERDSRNKGENDITSNLKSNANAASAKEVGSKAQKTDSKRENTSNSNTSEIVAQFGNSSSANTQQCQHLHTLQSQSEEPIARSYDAPPDEARFWTDFHYAPNDSPNEYYFIGNKWGLILGRKGGIYQPKTPAETIWRGASTESEFRYNPVSGRWNEVQHNKDGKSRTKLADSDTEKWVDWIWEVNPGDGHWTRVEKPGGAEVKDWNVEVRGDLQKPSQTKNTVAESNKVETQSDHIPVGRQYVHAPPHDFNFLGEFARKFVCALESLL